MDFKTGLVPAGCGGIGTSTPRPSGCRVPGRHPLQLQNSQWPSKAQDELGDSLEGGGGKCFLGGAWDKGWLPTPFNFAPVFLAEAPGSFFSYGRIQIVEFLVGLGNECHWGIVGHHVSQFGGFVDHVVVSVALHHSFVVGSAEAGVVCGHSCSGFVSALVPAVGFLQCSSTKRRDSTLRWTNSGARPRSVGLDSSCG